MADARHIENRFWLYLSAILAGWCEIWNRDEKSHADIGHVTKMAILENSSGGRPPFWKQLYLHISAVNYPISINFGKHSYHLQLIKMCTFRAPGKGSAVGVTECGGCHPTYKMHNQNNENVKWYFRDTSYNSWPLVWCHPEQLCLSRRRGFASPQSVYSTLFSPSVLLLIWRKNFKYYFWFIIIYPVSLWTCVVTLLCVWTNQSLYNLLILVTSYSGNFGRRQTTLIKQNSAQTEGRKEGRL